MFMNPLEIKVLFKFFKKYIDFATLEAIFLKLLRKGLTQNACLEKIKTFKIGFI